jgi:hypothetical protein
MDAGKQLRTAVFLARKAPFVLKAGLKQTFKKLPDSAIAQMPAAGAVTPAGVLERANLLVGGSIVRAVQIFGP